MVDVGSPDPSRPRSASGTAAADSSGFFHPSGRPYRFTILMFISLMVLGSYFAYDSIGALAPTLIEDLHLNRSTIGNLYTAYSVAAILIVFFGGMLYDKLGPRRSSFLFCMLVLVGATIVAMAHSSWQLFAGRLIFGGGSESLIVVQSAIISRWFKGKEMALAFGIALTISRIGTLFSFNTEELIARYFGSYRSRTLGSGGLLPVLRALQSGLQRHGPSWREGARASEAGGRRQDRLLRHPEVQLFLLVRCLALRHLL